MEDREVKSPAVMWPEQHCHRRMGLLFFRGGRKTGGRKYLACYQYTEWGPFSLSPPSLFFFFPPLQVCQNSWNTPAAEGRAGPWIQVQAFDFHFRLGRLLPSSRLCPP